ncbi:hypothetical protein Ahy_A03g015969 [Arachis hypogaea]|uniref:Uncharacterized protein n=1 Tax=Arachis hypogaea TaxID=3818 RepID=A0A445E1X9_ARAHY|nr:hypothetical protein Ahy_A03g015969 [Arachis hypogaea]
MQKPKSDRAKHISQSFVAAASGHRELSFIEIDARSYITRKLRNVYEQDNAKEFDNSNGFERVDKVTPKYILESRSKNIKRRHIHIKNNQDEPLLESRSKRFDNLVFRSHNVCEFESESEELTEILHQTFDNVIVKM